MNSTTAEQAPKQDDSIEGLEARLKEDPGSLLACFQLAQLFSYTHQFHKALTTLEQGLAQAPSTLSLLTLKLQVLLYAKRGPEAVRLAQELLDKYPDSHRVNIAVSIVRFWQGQLPDAVQLSQTAVASVITQPVHEQNAVKPDNFHEKGFEQLLWKTLAELAQAGVRAFPTSGTLLGLVREGQLLPFDKDIDVGLPFSQMQQAIDCITQYGWQEEVSSSRLINPRSFRHPSGLVVDLCGYAPVRDDKRMLGGFWQAGTPTQWQRITIFPELHLESTTRSEGKVWQLVEPEVFLGSLYGPNWHIPDPGFDTIVGARNLKGFSLMTEFYCYFHLYNFWQARKWHKAEGTLNASLRHQPNNALLQQYSDALRLHSPQKQPKATT